MKLIKKTIDINAHVQNITYQISTDADISVAIIGFDNLGFGTVTAIKFEAKGYNAFGDIVQINGKEKFFLIIQDILIEKNGQARNLKVILPDPYIKKLELVEAQICYSDGDVISYEGENLKEFEIEEYDEYGSEKDIVDALRDRFGINFKYKPIECLDGWICGCGRFNKSKIKCSGCGNLKEDLFKYTSESEIEKMIPLFKETSEKHVEADKQGTERKEKKKKNIFKAVLIY